MTDPITISLIGPPQGKGRARAFVRGGRAAMYTPQKTRSYESMIFGAAIDAMGERSPMQDAVELVLRAVYPIPKSWSERKRQKAITGEIKPVVKPDLDNVLKAWSDALNGVVYVDDAQIVLYSVEKQYGPQALVAVTVRSIEATYGDANG